MEFMSALQDELDEGKPSLFELLSEQQLAALLPPTIRYLLVLATQRYPRYLLRILNSYDEVYAVVDLLVQRHFLRTYGGGFTENFYGLKRERALRSKTGEAPRTALAAPATMRETLKLTEKDVWRNLAVMVGIPYIKRKLDEAYEIHAPQVTALLGAQYNRDRDALGSDATWRQRLQWYFKWFLQNVYPSLNAAYYFSMLAFNLAYLFDNTAYSSPFLWLIQTRIRRLGAADFHALEAMNDARSATKGGKPVPTASMFNPRNFTSVVLPRLLSSLRILLPTSIFALKFLEWWHASDFARQLSRKAAEALELPPPIVAGLPEQQMSASKDQKGEHSSRSPESPRRSALKKATPPTSSVSLANRPSTPPSEYLHTPPSSTPSSPSSARSNNKPHHTGFSAPIAASSGLPILTVPRPTISTSSLCPICVKAIVTPTAAQTGFVYCYTCIFKWVQGQHDRQEAWMRGEGGEEGWGEDDELERAARVAAGQDEGDVQGDEQSGEGRNEKGLRSRVGRWESGAGRDAVTGRRVLGGTDGLRRIMV